MPRHKYLEGVLQEPHLIQAKNSSWIGFITQSHVSGLCFIMELCCVMLVLRNFLLFWKMSLMTDHEHNSMRARFCKDQGGGYSRCFTLSWWLENKFCLIWFDFLCCTWLLRPPPFTWDPVEWSLGHAGLLETPQAQREMMHVIVNTPDGVLKQRALRQSSIS